MKAGTWRGDTRHLCALQHGSFLTVQNQFETQTWPPAARHVKRFLSSEAIMGQVLQRWVVQRRCHLVWRSGLAMNVALCSGLPNPPAPPPPAPPHGCNMLRIGLFSASSAETGVAWVCVTAIFELDLSRLAGSASICRWYLRQCYICLCAARTCKRIHARARGNLFMCHFVCWCSESGCNFSKLYT